jgi:peptidoglycan hydrolase-like protein with peptidoglycan-binding domain
MRVLKLGLAGADVTKWQKFLHDSGFYDGPIDGEFGSQIVKATKDYQKSNGLKADGVVGNKSFAKAMSQGFELLPSPRAQPASAKVVKVKTIADGVTIFKLESGEAVFFTSDLDVDADGCPMAYGPGNKGLDHNGNAQTPVGSGNWNPSVLVLDSAKQPVKQKVGDPAPGFFICKSSLQDTSKPVTDPRRYVDALTIPFIVLPGGSAGPAKTGDAALVIDMRTGKRIKGLVADAGPSGKTGEASILVVGVLADDLTPKQVVDAAKRNKLKGLHCNPRNGGLNGPDDRKFRYIVFPGTTMTWPQTIGAIEARVDGALATLTPEQIVAITT